MVGSTGMRALLSRVASHASILVLATAGGGYAVSLVACGNGDHQTIQRARRPDASPGIGGSFDPTDTITSWGGAFTTSDDPVGVGGEGGSGGSDPGAGGANGGFGGDGGGGADAGRSDAPLVDGGRPDAKDAGSVDARGADARDRLVDAGDSRRDADGPSPPDASPTDVGGVPDACSLGIVGTFYLS